MKNKVFFMDGNLLGNRTPIIRTSRSWFSLFRFFIPLMIFFFIFCNDVPTNDIILLFVLFPLPYMILYKYYYRYYIFQDHIIIITGFIFQRATEIKANRVGNINIKQNILYMLLNIGHIKLNDFSSNKVINFDLVHSFKKIKMILLFKEGDFYSNNTKK